MNTTINWNKTIKKINIWLMLIIVIILGISTLLSETFEMLELDELDEIHEFCGFTFFALIGIHLVLYRKGLMNLLTFKTI
jgi:cytochrome b561